MRLFIGPWLPFPIIVAPVIPPPVPPPPPYPAAVVATPTGAVDTNVRPRDARVFVDGEFRGLANSFDGAAGLLELPVGRHTIEFKREGFETVALIVRIEARQVVSIDLALKDARGAAAGERAYQVETEGTGYLEMRVAPADAAVYVDGSFYGPASQFQNAGHKVMLRSGAHVIEIAKPGYVLYRNNVVITEKETLQLELNLEKQP